MLHSYGTLLSASTSACRHIRSNVATQIESWAISLLRTTTTSISFSSKGKYFSLLVTGSNRIFQCLLENLRRVVATNFVTYHFPC